MYYNGRPPPTNNWPSNVQYPPYHPDRVTTKKRLKIIWILALAIASLILSVAALIIVFAVEHSWFSDSFTTPNLNFTQPYSNHYGLWRLCLFPNQTCDSWYSTDGPTSAYIEQRLNQAKVGINAWQALEIVFIFLTTPALIVALASIICYRLQRSIHYYLAILSVFIIWPAVLVGISALFVFGFAVYNVAPTPRNLDWCFYVNLVAVILSCIGALLLTIYAFLVKKPINDYQDDTIVESFADINGYPAALNPSTFVVVKKNKRKRTRPYNYPNQYIPPPTRTVPNVPNTDYVTNPNYRMIAPYTSGINNPPLRQQRPLSPYRDPDYLTSASGNSIPPPPRYYRPPLPSYSYQPSHWHRPQSNSLNYNSEPSNDYVQRGIYRPPRLNPIDRPFEQSGEPRVLHYYTGYDHFATVDTSDVILSRHAPGSASPARYTNNHSYYHQNDYIKSAM